MAWNEPGGSQGGKDPWGGGNGEQGPPDLSEVVRKMQEKYGGLFGGGKGPGKGGGGGMKRAGAAGMIVIVVVALGLWLATGFYKVDQAERGVVLRFGKYVQTTMPGLNWHWPYPIEEVTEVNVELSQNLEFGFHLLTQDENIVDLRFEVQFKIQDPKDYLFEVEDPVNTLRVVTESSVREVVGESTMDYVITEGRSDIARRTQALAQSVIDRYKSGLLITRVNMQKATAPQQVQAAFADAVKAREDEERLKNEAEAYANAIIPKARGAAAQQLEQANAYKARVVAQAEGEASRFSKILAEYMKAPAITRERLYLETMENILSKTGKVMVDVKDGGNIMYLPLDRLMQQTGQRARNIDNTRPDYSVLPTNQMDTSEADALRRRAARGRGVR